MKNSSKNSNEVVMLGSVELKNIDKPYKAYKGKTINSKFVFGLIPGGISAFAQLKSGDIVYVDDRITKIVED